MKIIKYQKMISAPNEQHKEPNLISCQIACEANHVDSNMAVAKEEAYLGMVTVEDVPDSHKEPTQLDKLEAQIAYTAMMTNTLMEGSV